MSNTRRRFLGALGLLPLTLSKSNLVFGQATIGYCETKTLRKGVWQSHIDARKISITLKNSRDNFVSVEALSLYEGSEDAESPYQTEYFDIYKEGQFESGPLGYRKAPLNPEITITLENGRPKVEFVVNDILQNIDITNNTIRYVSKNPGERGLYIVNGKPVTQTPMATLHLITDGQKPQINKVWNADISQSSMSPNVDIEYMLFSQKLILAYAFDDEPMYYLDIPMQGITELVEESIKAYVPITQKLAQDMCEYDDCFVTSATCGHIGLTDDCWELTQLRAFRDNYLVTLPNGKSLVDKYYDTAPKLLQVINNKINKSNILQSIYFRDILPSAILAKLKLNKLALWRYKAMMERLEKQYLNI
ncbi:MAG: CFI-box-CTERM domain-containing protein [Paraglaciecola sp.]|uniref:CFI-box-CTERM domain-containing protein n=1 Tax=Paraglaciecola sp. TaxID=1920173 RepID=UPI0032973FD8